MRLRKIEECEMVQCDNFLDFINCGACYLLTDWINRKNATVTLSQNTILEDLHEKHGGSIWYHKLCRETFRAYRGEHGEAFSKDLDKVVNYTKIIDFDEYPETQLLKALVTGVGLEKLSSFGYLVRWAKEESSRGEDWYLVIDD